MTSMESLGKIYSIKDLSRIVNELISLEPLLLIKVQKNLSCSASKAHEGLLELMKFLALVGHYKTSLTPSIFVDDVWHEFILFTKTYDQFCREHFGRFIHHQPDEEQSTNKRRFRRLVALYELHYGVLPESLWGNVGSYSECGSCESL